MRHTGHIRERSAGSFEILYSLGTDPATGSRKIATATVRGSRREAENELRRLLRSVDILALRWRNAELDRGRCPCGRKPRAD